MDKLTLETLPIAFSQLSIDVGEIKQLLRQLNIREDIDSGRWLSLKEFCEYHPDKPSRATVYGWVSAHTVPVHKSGKKLRFLKSEVDNWLLQGKKISFEDTVANASCYLTKSKGGNSHE